MAQTADFTTYGFFNSIMPLNQTNWASYFGPIIPDGVIAGVGNEMEVYADSSGMHVFVKTGECRVRSHMGVLSETATLDIAASDPSYHRIDLVIARVNYGNPSTMELAVKTGTPAAAYPYPVPVPTQIAGDVWEMPLARVAVMANTTSITSDDVDSTYRRIYNMNEGFGNFTIMNLSNTIGLWYVFDNYEYRVGSPMTSNVVQLVLPDETPDHFHCKVSFTSSSGFLGVSFFKGDMNTSYSPKLAGATLTQKSKRYHLDIFWDGEYYWCNAMAA